MNSSRLDTLNSIKTQDTISRKLCSSSAIIEKQIAEDLWVKKKANFEELVENLFIESNETWTAIDGNHYPFRPQISKQLIIQSNRIQKGKMIPILADHLETSFYIDEEFFENIIFFVKEYDSTHKPFRALLSNIFPKEWSYHKASLVKRIILIGLMEKWSKDNSDEPILWKVSEILETLINGSSFAVSKAFEQICFADFMEESFNEQNNITDFFVKLNSDKSGNILDNLIISKDVYERLVDDGWKSEKIEFENLPLSIGMFLSFLEKNGFAQVGYIGDIKEINLRESLEEYRYVGSPFLTNDVIKQVEITAPGWEYHGELVIRPIVQEVER